MSSKSIKMGVLDKFESGKRYSARKIKAYFVSKYLASCLEKRRIQHLVQQRAQSFTFRIWR